VKVRLSLLLLAVFGFATGRAQVAPPLTDDEIRSILSDRVERAKRALGIVVGIVDEHGTRVIGYGKPDKNSTQTVIRSSSSAPSRRHSPQPCSRTWWSAGKSVSAIRFPNICRRV
jgi:hypothetical protein